MKTILGFFPNQESLLAVLLAIIKSIGESITELIALRKRNNGG